MVNSVSIDGKDVMATYGLHLVSKSIGFPEAQTKMVEIPLRDGALDLTESLTGLVKYSNRTLTMSLLYRGRDTASKASAVARALHGKRAEIIFDDDAEYYYVGRMSVSTEFQIKRTVLTVKIEADCEPYKYEIQGSDEDWLWDPFDFEDGIINETKDISVPGTAIIIARTAGQIPTFTASAAVTMTYGGKTYSLASGENKFYDLYLAEGENTFKFTGSGAVTIHYRGRSL